jgi:murein DD-endopeptidase MepM/ murein hydrolase activator NlpD
VAARARNWTEVRRLVQGADAGLPDLILYANKFLRLTEQPVEPPAGVDYSKYRFPVVGYTGPINLHWGLADGIGGSDIFAARGTDIVAITDGTITYRAAWDRLGGNAVVLTHDHDGKESYYAHGDQTPLVQHGQHVAAGTKFFGLGDSGNATAAGPHLHFGMGDEINNGGGPQGGLGTDFNAVEFLRGLQAHEGGTTPPVEPPLPCADLISTVGYFGGDLVRRLDQEILSQMPIPALEAKASKRTKAYWQARAEQLEKEIHEAYRDGTALKDEMIRAATEALT